MVLLITKAHSMEQATRDNKHLKPKCRQYILNVTKRFEHSFDKSCNKTFLKKN